MISHLRKSLSYWGPHVHVEARHWLEELQTPSSSLRLQSQATQKAQWIDPYTCPIYCYSSSSKVDCVWNVMAHAQKPDFVFRWNGRVHLNRQGRQFSRLLAAEVCASAVVMVDTPCSEVVWSVLATHSIRQFPLHFPPVRHRVPSHFNWTLPPSTSATIHSHKWRSWYSSLAASA
jgi:hypothetical protein